VDVATRTAVTTQVKPFPCQRDVDGVADVVSVRGGMTLFGYLCRDTPGITLRGSQTGPGVVGGTGRRMVTLETI